MKEEEEKRRREKEMIEDLRAELSKAEYDEKIRKQEIEERLKAQRFIFLNLSLIFLNFCFFLQK